MNAPLLWSRFQNNTKDKWDLADKSFFLSLLRNKCTFPVFYLFIFLGWKDIYSHHSELIREQTSLMCQKLQEMILRPAEECLTESVKMKYRRTWWELLNCTAETNRYSGQMNQIRPHQSESWGIAERSLTLPSHYFPIPLISLSNPKHPTTKFLTSSAAMYL